MGGIWRKIPWTYTVMWIGSLALAGIPFFSGYYSKDAILEAAWARQSSVGTYGFICGVIAAFLTAFYSWRLLILTFHGRPRASQAVMDHVHESPASMVGPLIVLAAGAVLAGIALKNSFIGENWHQFWQGAIANSPDNNVMHDMHYVPALVSMSPTLVGLLGIGLAYIMYVFRPELPARAAAAAPMIYRFVLNKWYFDELYDAVFIRPFDRLARLLWNVGDAKLIDGMPNGIASLAAGGSAQIVRIQSGSIAVYAFTMLIGLVALVTVFLLFR